MYLIKVNNGQIAFFQIKLEPDEPMNFQTIEDVVQPQLQCHDQTFPQANVKAIIYFTFSHLFPIILHLTQE